MECSGRVRQFNRMENLIADLEKVIGKSDAAVPSPIPLFMTEA